MPGTCVGIRAPSVHTPPGVHLAPVVQLRSRQRHFNVVPQYPSDAVRRKLRDRIEGRGRQASRRLVPDALVWSIKADLRVFVTTSFSSSSGASAAAYLEPSLEARGYRKQAFSNLQGPRMGARKTPSRRSQRHPRCA